MNENIPDSSVRRLSAYLRQLEVLAATGVERVYSKQLAKHLLVGDAQVRRDLALFGQFGRPGVGYEVADLIEVIRVILGTRRQWKVVIVGAGQLSGALLRYPGFGLRGFDLVAAFDVDDKKIGTQIGNTIVRPMEELEDVIDEYSARLAILAVPPDVAQPITDRLVRAGIEGILNFATSGLDTPGGVYVSNVDITAHLEELSFKVNSNRP